MPELIWSAVPALSLTSDTALQHEWDRLNALQSNLPFLGSDSVSLALKVFGTGTEKLIIARNAGRVCAMILLAPAGKLQWQTFQPSQLPLGAWVAEPTLPVETIANSAMHSGKLFAAAALSFTQVDPLFAPRGTDTPCNRYDDYIETAWVGIAGSFDDYWAGRGKNLRQNMRKQRNKLQTEGIELKMHVWRDASDMAAAIARYGELESQSWKAHEGTAIQPNNDQGRFYTELLCQNARRGEAVVYEYTFAGKLVASNLCVHRAKTLTILKTAYDASIKAYSPAFLLNEEILQSIFSEQQISRLEYYGRVMEWHTRWTDSKRTLYHLTTFRNSWVKRVSQLLSSKTAKGAAVPAQSDETREPGSSTQIGTSAPATS